MGGAQSAGSYRECIDYQQANPSKECCYPGGEMCDTICIDSLGSVPECEVGATEAMQKKPKKKPFGEDLPMWIRWLGVAISLMMILGLFL